MPFRRPAWGYLLALAAVSAWGFNFVIARLISGDIPPLTLAFGRWAVAGVIFLFIGAAAIRRDGRQLCRQWRILLPASITGILLFNSTIYLGAQSSQASNLALIAATSPIFTLLFNYRKDGWPLPRQWLGVLIALLGVAVLLGEGDPRVWQTLTFRAGDGWMLAGAIFWAAYTVLLQYKPAAVSMTAFHALSIWLALPGLLALTLWQEQQQAIHWTPAVIGGVLYVGIVASIFCYYCWNAAIVRIGAARTGLVYYLLPLLASGEALLVLGEPLHSHHFIAMLLVIGGVFIASRRRHAARTG